MFQQKSKGGLGSRSPHETNVGIDHKASIGSLRRHESIMNLTSRRERERETSESQDQQHQGVIVVKSTSKHVSFYSITKKMLAVGLLIINVCL